MRAYAEHLRACGFKPFPLAPETKAPFFDRLPWTNTARGRATWKKTLDARYRNEIGFPADAELDAMFPPSARIGRRARRGSERYRGRRRAGHR
jgi:hypothetical protein